MEKCFLLLFYYNAKHNTPKPLYNRPIIIVIYRLKTFVVSFALYSVQL